MNSWQGFLPENAIIMTRAGGATQRVATLGPLLMFVGTKPTDAEEQLLNKMTEAMGLSREQVRLTDVDGCRPPFAQLIVTLGEDALQGLLGPDSSLAQSRGSFLNYQGIKMMPTFHPSYLIQNPASKKEAWTDLQKVAKELGIEIPQSSKKRET